MKLSDIARLAGVSVTTASYVINGKAEQQRISNSTVERVQAVVQAHGFTPNPQAAGLRSRHTRTLGFILPDLENPSYARIAKRLEQGARARGYQLLIASSDDQPDSERQLQQLFRARRCDALFVASCLPPQDQSYRELQDKGLPVIAIDRGLDPRYFCSVISDDHDASRRLAASLLSTAPSSIALIGARPELSVSQARAGGFDDALQGFAGEVRRYQGEAFSRECGQRLMQQLIDELGHLPDALITTSYVLLQGCSTRCTPSPSNRAGCSWALSATTNCSISCRCRSMPWPSVMVTWPPRHWSWHLPQSKTNAMNPACMR